MESPTTAGAAKVAIPRLPRHGSGDQLGDDGPRARVRRACLNCRKRKVKCSGEAPRCVNCIGTDLDCVYDTARRDQLKSATNKNKDLVLLLKELSLRTFLDDTDKSRIQDALEEFEDDSTSVVSVQSQKRRKLSAPGEPAKADDENPPKSIQAHNSLDSEEGLALLDEDLLRSRISRSTGYVGQGSGVQWLRSLQDTTKPEGPVQRNNPDNNNATAAPEQSSAQSSGPSASVTDASFYLDADSAELDVDVDPYELPLRETATKLFECYKQSVHKSFPILPSQFEDQFHRYFKAVESESTFSVPDKWLAILNIVFAIGARFSHLINAGWQGEERDHLVYMTRSIRLLGYWPFAAAPDLALIQVSGLLAFYYQVVGHVSRGWVMIGISIRLALALGLHLRNEDPSIPLGKKETLLRTWWTLHAIECQLSAITGRPCVLSHEDCTVALPMTFSEEAASSSSSLNTLPPARDQDKSVTPASSSKAEKNRRLQTPRSYLDAHLNIGLIMQKLLSALYSPRTAQYPWKYIQDTIPNLLRELDEWKHGALPEHDLSDTQFFPSPEGSLMLRFSYFSTKILITRPCLCRSRRKTKDQSDASAVFDQQMAETCVKAALGLAELMPSSDPQSLYEKGPWWSIVHIIMQAMAVLLLELSYSLNHMQGDRPEAKKSVKKMLGWLITMRHTDAVVERAHNVIVRILQQHKYQAIFRELLTEDLEDPEERSVHEYTQHAAPSFGYSHPEQTNYPTTNENMPQIPPNEWYGGPYTAHAQPEHGIFDPTTDPPLPAQMDQMPSPYAEQF